MMAIPVDLHQLHCSCTTRKWWTSTGGSFNKPSAQSTISHWHLTSVNCNGM